jgi:hypothetical protein
VLIIPFAAQKFCWTDFHLCIFAFLLVLLVMHPIRHC